MIGMHSLWSSPLINTINTNRSWHDIKFYYLSWILSNALLNKHFSKTILVTDYYGKEVLVDILGLEYNEIQTGLENFDINPKYWTFGKIYAYNSINKPFLHIDSDAFLWKKDILKYKTKKIFIQNIEKDVQTYKDAHYSLFKEELISNVAYNTGIVGGESLEVFKSLYIYMLEIEDVYLKNKLFSERESTDIAIYVEQLGIKKACEKHGIKAKSIIPQIKQLRDYRNLAYIPKSKHSFMFSHILGPQKKEIYNYSMIEKFVKDYNPRSYARLMDFLKKGIL